jgi:hypothetical protein
MSPAPQRPWFTGAEIDGPDVIVPEGFVFPPICLRTGRLASECRLEMATFALNRQSGPFRHRLGTFRFFIAAQERQRIGLLHRRIKLATATALLPWVAFLLMGLLAIKSRDFSRMIDRTFSRAETFLPWFLVFDGVALALLAIAWTKSGSFFLRAKLRRDFWGKTTGIVVRNVHPRVLARLRPP